jgi:hypothetical protein
MHEDAAVAARTRSWRPGARSDAASGADRVVAAALDENGWRAVQARRPWRLFATSLAAVAALVASCWLVHRAHAPTRSEIDLVAASQPKVPRPWRAAHPLDAPRFARVDMAAVHERLFPAWILALQNEPYTRGRDEEQRAFRALRAEAGQDPNLDELLLELRDRATDGVLGWAGHIRELFDGWNTYLERAGSPWRVEHSVAATALGGRLLALTYRVLADLEVGVGGRPRRVLLLARADRTNLGEGYFGQTSRRAKVGHVVADRVAEHAVERVWPMLDPEGDGRLPVPDRAFAPRLRLEADRALGIEATSVLREAAGLRRQLADRLALAGACRGCGSTVAISHVPWSGLADRSEEALRRAAKRNERRRCARLTVAEADALVAASRRLATAPGLEEALGRLAAWVARAVVVHEARHVADAAGAAEGAGDLFPTCPPGSTGLRAEEQAEVSAYLAAMGDEDVGQLSLLHACGLDLGDSGANATAFAFVQPRLVPAGCEAGPPVDLGTRARALERELFGRAERIALPDSFPAALPLRR